MKWAKSRVRALLTSAKAEPRDWPLSIQQASSTAWAKAFPISPTTRAPATPFGHPVWFRAKAYKGTTEKKHDPTGVRWKKGWYRGPSYDVNRGHIIMREDGGLTIAKSVKFNVVEPEKDLPDLLPPALTDDFLVEPEGTDALITKEGLRGEIEFISQKLLEKGSYTNKDMLYLFEKLEELGNTDFRVGKKTPMTSWYTGAFVHGGIAGLRGNPKRFPFTTKYMANFASKYNGGKSFTAVGVTRNSALGMHRDVHNSKFTENMVLPISSFEGGGVWIEEEDVSEDSKVIKQVPHRGDVPGRVLQLHGGQVVAFKPNRWHEVQPWVGDRVVMLMYTRGQRS